MNRKGVVRVVPPPELTSHGMLLTKGTRVFVDDVEIQNVTGIILYAEINSIWRAEIQCSVLMEEMRGMQGVIIVTRSSWWQRLCDWLQKKCADEH